MLTPSRVPRRLCQLVECLVALVALTHTQTLVHAIFVLCLFPISLVLVAGLEAAGFD